MISISISKSQEERLPCTGQILSLPDNLGTHNNAISEPSGFSYPDPSMFISFPSISIPRYPQILIHSVHSKAQSHLLQNSPLFFQPFAATCFLFESFDPTTNSPPSSAPCTIPPTSGLQAPTFCTCCSAPLPLPV